MPKEKEPEVLLDEADEAEQPSEVSQDNTLLITPAESPLASFEEIVEKRSLTNSEDEDHEDSQNSEILSDVELSAPEAEESQNSDTLTKTDQPNQLKPEGAGNGVRSRRSLDCTELLTVELVDRAKSAADKLRSNLVGTILFDLTDLDKRFLFDWRGEQPLCQKVDESEAECTIALSSNSLMRIYDGDINPQLAMLTDKVKVAGKASYAIYIFNLFSVKTHY